MADLFDIVKAAPPPLKVRDSPKQTNPARTPSPACSLPPPISSPLSDNSLNGGENILLTPTKRAIVRLKRFSLQEGADSKPIDSKLDLLSRNARSCLTKTKAQQKQFDDELPLSSSDSNNADSVNSKKDLGNDIARKCCVRLKRLSDTDIAQYATQQKKRRGRPKKNRNIETSSSPSMFTKAASVSPIKPSSAQKRKLNSSEPIERLSKKRVNCPTPIHFKLSRPKSPKLTSKKARMLTPPPAASTPIIKSRKGKTSLIKQYGAKVFRSFVHMERCKHPLALAFEANERARKSRRPNLSVSFRDAVEIIGQSADMCSSVPTRLTKVENGKVVESTVLDQAGFLMPSPVKLTTGLSSAKRHRKKRETSDKINSSRRATKTSRHSGDRLPVSGMARLRIDDDAAIDEDEENAEYIVPNEMPVSKHSINNSTKVKDKSPNLEAAATQEANKEEEEEEELSRKALKSPLPPSPKPSTSILSPINEEETPPYKIATEEQSHDEICDSNKCKTEELTKASTMGPTPRRALKSPSPLNEQKDQDVTENDEATNVASTNVTPTKSVVADEISAALKQTENLRSPSVDSDASFCSAKDILEQVNGESNREIKLKSPLQTPDTSIFVKETEENQSLETGVPNDETEAVTEPEIPEKTNGLDQDEINIQPPSPVECLQLKSEFSSDDDDSETAIRKLIVEDTDDGCEKIDETNTQSSVENDQIEQPKLNMALLNPPKITRKSPTPTDIDNDNDEHLQELDDTLNLHQDEDDELCLNLREQVSDFTAATGSLVEDLMKALDP